jgi:hypothetical protein
MNTQGFKKGDFIRKSETINLSEIYQIVRFDNNNIASSYKCIFNAENHEIAFETIEVSDENEVYPRYTPVQYKLNLDEYQLVELDLKNRGN